MTISKGAPLPKNRQRGQVIVEYILLLLVAVAVASIFVRLLVKRSADEKGALFQRWEGIGKQIGNDNPEK